MTDSLLSHETEESGGNPNTGALVLFIVLGNGIALTAEPVSMLVLVELFSLSDKLRIAFNELGMAFLKFDQWKEDMKKLEALSGNQVEDKVSLAEAAPELAPNTVAAFLFFVKCRANWPTDHNCKLTYQPSLRHFCCCQRTRPLLS